MIKNHIELFANCPDCLDERPADVTPSDWARLNVGMTKEGMQIWCVRHDKNVVSLDFHGQKITSHFDPETLKRRLDATAARTPRQRISKSHPSVHRES